MCKNFRYFLKFRRFLIRTDHQPLTRLHALEPVTSFEARMFNTLGTFDFDIEYRQGKKHGNADGLSRAIHADPCDESEAKNEDEAENEFASVTSIHHLRPFIATVAKVGPFFTPRQAGATSENWSPAWWRYSQQQDDALSWMAAWKRQPTKSSTTEPPPPSTSEAAAFGPYGKWLKNNYESLDFDSDDILCYRNRPDSETKTADKAHPCVDREVLSRLVPSKFQVQAIVRAHESSAHRQVTAPLAAQLHQICSTLLHLLCTSIANQGRNFGHQGRH